MDTVRLLLCAYGDAGAHVVKQAADLANISDLLVVTHEPGKLPVTDVREIADECGVPWTVANVNDISFPASVLSSVWYRHVVQAPVLAKVNGRAFNLHPSLLPKHRGCSSVPWAILEGDAETGVTAHYMDEGIDTGRILLQRRVPITGTTTAAQLYASVNTLAASMWAEALDLVISGAPGHEQVGEGCYHPRGAPHNGIGDAGWDSLRKDRFVRAMTHPPLPAATFK